MSPPAVVFLGPSLPPAVARARLAADYRGPAALGDVLAAVAGGARTVVLIDGLFETTRAVWHQELLWALARGVTVIGAASMGALRAAELAPFGMLGVGLVFEAYRDGRLLDDAEVAVLHAPGELGWRPLTLALVDVRAVLAAAVTAGILTPCAAARLVALAAAMSYKDRTWPALTAAAALAGLDAAALAALRSWLPAAPAPPKWQDAVAALDVAACPPRGAGARGFVETVFWRRFADGAGGTGDGGG